MAGWQLGERGAGRSPALGSILAAGGSALRPADSLGHSCLGLQHPQQCRTTPVLGTTLLPGLPPALPTSAQRERSPAAGAGPLPVALPQQSRSLPPPGRDGCNKEEKEERSVSPPPRRWSQDPGESQLPPAWGRQSGVAPLTAILRLLPRCLAALRRGRAAALPDHFALTKALGKAASPPPPPPPHVSPPKLQRKSRALGAKSYKTRGKRKIIPWCQKCCKQGEGRARQTAWQRERRHGLQATSAEHVWAPGQQDGGKGNGRKQAAE